MSPRQPSTAVVALLGAVLLAAALVPTAVTGAATPDTRPAALAQPEGCEFRDDSGHLGYLEAEYDYAAGLANDTAGDWSGGTILRIGANGDCSLAVTNGSATLTATRVDGRTGVLRATVDVGEDGAIRAVAGDGTASVALENVGRENGAAVAVVVRRANGTAARTNLTAPSGRFVDLTMRWSPDGTVRVAVREPEARSLPDEFDATVETGARNASWAVELRSRAYLDEVAVGTRTATPTPTEGAAGPEPGDGSDAGDEPGPDDDFFDGPTPADRGADGGDSNGGLVLGPIVALAGGGIYRFAYGLAKFDEQTDAIGSKTPASEVEPADWNVALTKGFGALVALAGIGWFLSAVASAL